VFCGGREGGSIVVGASDVKRLTVVSRNSIRGLITNTSRSIFITHSDIMAINITLIGNTHLISR
jgi:N-methylhydantoinase B/oxoprolinase/acetone carboxylase alpha subunit